MAGGTTITTLKLQSKDNSQQYTRPMYKKEKRLSLSLRKQKMTYSFDEGHEVLCLFYFIFYFYLSPTYVS